VSESGFMLMQVSGSGTKVFEEQPSDCFIKYFIV